MKVWTNTLTLEDLHDACPGNVELRDPSPPLHNGKRSRYFDGVTLRTYAPRRPNVPASPHSDYGTAANCASYDEHGYWMAELFERDPEARIKSAINDFRGREDFHVQTSRKYS